MKNVLVTGGAGFIGSNFVRHLLSEEREVRVVNIDALTYAGSLENLSSLIDPARHIFVHGDIGDGDLVLRLITEYAIDTIVHFAAETHVDRSITAPRAFIETNINGTFRLLESARLASVSTTSLRTKCSGRSHPTLRRAVSQRPTRQGHYVNQFKN